MIKFACKGCGFASPELALGLVPRPDEYDPVLVSCESCKTLRAVHLPEAIRGCRRHRRPFLLLNEEGRVPCPRCGKALAQDMVGLWD